MGKILVTNVNQYAGPGITEVLVRQGNTALCHDPAFADQERRREFAQSAPSLHPLAAPDEKASP
jgi:3-oxoacyl-[acyl-carrier protein] reductase